MNQNIKPYPQTTKNKTPKLFSSITISKTQIIPTLIFKQPKTPTTSLPSSTKNNKTPYYYPLKNITIPSIKSITQNQPLSPPLPYPPKSIQPNNSSTKTK